MRSIKPPYTVTIEITEDADGWHLLTPEAYERRRMAREFIVKEYQTFPYKGAVYEMPELVRCKDCKWLGVANLKDKYGQPNPVPCCRGNGNIRIGIKPDDYCSRAERKEE